MTQSSDHGLVEIPRQVWTVTWVVVFGAFMGALDSSLVNVGLDTIGTDLHSALTSVQWVASGYLLALGAALPISAWLGRRMGTGRLWLASLAVFTVASVLCAAAPNLTVLILMRLFQGLAGGLLVPAGQSVIGEIAGPKRLGRVMNTAGLAVVVAPALGPTIGGLLIHSLSWRWLFLINVPIGAIALVLGFRLMPLDRGRRSPLDLSGLVLLAGGLSVLSYGIIQASGPDGPLTARTIGTLAAGAAALLAYVFTSRGKENPILSLRLFANRVYSAASVAAFFTGAALFGGVIILPLYFELLRGRSVIDTGLLLLAFGAGTAASMRSGGRLTDRLGGGIVGAIGLAISVVTTLPFIFLDAHADLVLIEIILFLRGAGMGLAGVPLMTAAFATAPRELISHATAELNIVQRVAGAVGSGMFVAILEHNGPATLSSFRTTFFWLTVTAVGALIVACWVAVESRRATETEAAAPVPVS